MKVLVTGGAGYIGSALIGRLAQCEHIEEILIYDNISHGRHGVFFNYFNHLKPASCMNISFVRGDLLDRRTLKSNLEGVDAVVHLAAKVSTPFAHGDPHSFEQVNHWGTAELSYIVEEGNIEQVVYLSSAAVYGASEIPLDSQASTQPRSWYGVSKLRGEEMLTRLSSSKKIHILRCANVYGFAPSARFDAVINRFLLQSHFEGRITIQGKGEQKRPFVHIDSVVSSIVGVLDSDLKSGVYNLVQNNMSIIDVAYALKDIYPELEMIFVEQDMERHSLVVQASEELQEYIESANFVEELRVFAGRFAF